MNAAARGYVVILCWAPAKPCQLVLVDQLFLDVDQQVVHSLLVENLPTVAAHLANRVPAEPGDVLKYFVQNLRGQVCPRGSSGHSVVLFCKT